MKQIPLSQNEFTIVDDDAYEYLSQWKWTIENGYATRKIKTNQTGNRQATIRLHREILNAPQGLVVDHINGNRLDNRRANLRICTHAQNMMNRKLSTNNTSGFKGVQQVGKRWLASITVNKETKRIGLFDTPTEAAQAYQKYASELFGEFNRTEPHETDTITLSKTELKELKEAIRDATYDIEDSDDNRVTNATARKLRNARNLVTRIEIRHEID